MIVDKIPPTAEKNGDGEKIAKRDKLFNEG